ncbi:hypothetical protein CCP2SC5_700002 [Azospirillaceae bacterium]
MASIVRVLGLPSRTIVEINGVLLRRKRTLKNDALSFGLSFEKKKIQPHFP